jgi:ribosome hibernation promoting factor
MQIEVHGRNLPVTPPLREYVGKRFQRLDRLFTRECTCDVELAVERNPRIADSQIAEATLLTRGQTLRARSTATDMYAAIDGLADRLRRQVADISERRADGRRRGGARSDGAPENGAVPGEDEVGRADDELETA